MKKIAFVLVAMLTMVFTACKTESTQVTVYVEDTGGVPVADREVLFADYASIILGESLSDLDETVSSVISDYWRKTHTNAQGTVTIIISMSVSKRLYCFHVYDAGKDQWLEKNVELHRGINAEVNFVVSR